MRSYLHVPTHPQTKIFDLESHRALPMESHRSTTITELLEVEEAPFDQKANEVEPFPYPIKCKILV